MNAFEYLLTTKYVIIEEKCNKCGCSKYMKINSGGIIYTDNNQSFITKLKNKIKSCFKYLIEG